MLNLIQGLIVDRWGNQPFYKIAEKEHPGFVRAMLQDMIESVDKAKSENPKSEIKSLDDLLYVPWTNLTLKRAFGMMLQEGLIYDRGSPANKGTVEGLGSSPRDTKL